MTGFAYIAVVRLFCSLLLLLVCSGAPAAESPPQVLVINSYHPGYRGSDDMQRGFVETLRQRNPAVELTVEYLDAKHYSGHDYQRRLLDLIEYKYRGRRFDLIFAGDDDAFNLVEQHRSRLFPGIPVIFAGTNFFDAARLKDTQLIAGIDERPSFDETLALILQLQPEVRRVLVIRDDSLSGKINGAAFREVARQFEDRLAFEELAGLPLEQLLKRVQGLQRDTALVYFSSFVRTDGGEIVSSNAALRRLADAAPVPVYGGWEFNLGSGLLGGRLVDLRRHGVAAAELADQVLRGVPFSRLPPLAPSPNPLMFDARQLERFGISEKKLPPGSTVINRTPGFWEANRVLLLTAASFSLAAVAVLIYLRLLAGRRQLADSVRQL